VKRFRGGLVFKAYRLVYHSTLGCRVIKKKKKHTFLPPGSVTSQVPLLPAVEVRGWENRIDLTREAQVQCKIKLCGLNACMKHDWVDVERKGVSLTDSRDIQVCGTSGSGWQGGLAEPEHLVRHLSRSLFFFFITLTPRVE